MDSEAPPPSDPKAQGGSPPPGPGPAAFEPGRLVASAVPFYGVLFGLAWLWRSAWFGAADECAVVWRWWPWIRA